jgi:hypothetical protein
MRVEASGGWRGCAVFPHDSAVPSADPGVRAVFGIADPAGAGVKKHRVLSSV